MVGAVYEQSIGSHPPVTTVSRLLDLISCRPACNSLAAKRVNTHQDEVIILALAKSF